MTLETKLSLKFVNFHQKKKKTYVIFFLVELFLKQGI